MITTLIAFAGIAAITVAAIHEDLTEHIVASSSGVPKAWSGMPQALDAVVSLDASADNNLVRYTAAISNNRSDSSLYLTNLASYVEETHGLNVGFLPLDDDTLEYTYNPDDQSSWQHLTISEPGNGRQDFRLNNSLEIGPTRTVNNTLYLRYQVSATADEEILNNKIAVILNNGKNYNALATTSTSVAVQPSDDEYSTLFVAADSLPESPHALFDQMAGEASAPQVIASDIDGVDSAYARPLGVHSYGDAKTLVSVANTIGSIDGGFINATSMTLVSILAVFSIAFIGYIVVKKY